MALVHKSFSFIHFFLYFTIISCCLSGLCSANRNIELDDNDWKQILDGEWMVLFYAPWCPACNGLEPAWREFYRRAHEKSLPVRAASVDITKWPALSGRFVVTTLPTLFHIKDAEVRLYKGPRNADAFLAYVEESKWKQTEPISSWKAPQSLQMTLVAEFFRLSQTLRDLHTHLTEEYGLPTWGSYLIFALVTILVGTLLGLFLVCLIDLLYPPKRVKTVFISKAQVDEMTARGELQKKIDEEEELINDDIVDDAEKCRNSDPEKYSDKDSDEEEVEGSGDKKAKVEEVEKQSDGNEKDDGEEKPSEVRKRRPRKAD